MSNFTRIVREGEESLVLVFEGWVYVSAASAMTSTSKASAAPSLIAVPKRAAT